MSQQFSLYRHSGHRGAEALVAIAGAAPRKELSAPRRLESPAVAPHIDSFTNVTHGIKAGDSGGPRGNIFLRFTGGRALRKILE